jgi:ABC-2 type transport system permease protein
VKGLGQVIKGEWQTLFADPGVLLILLGTVVLYSFFYPLPYLPEVVREVPVAVVDQDRSALSRRLVRMSDAHPALRIALQAQSVAEAEAAVQAGRVSGLIVIPAGFDRTIARGGQASVGLYADANYFLLYRQAMTGMATVARTLSAGIEIRRLQAGGKTARQAAALQRPLRLEAIPLFNPGEGYATYVVPAVLVLILQQTLLIGIGMVGGTARERGALPGPGGPGPLALLAGKTAVYLSLYAIHGIYYFFILFRIYGFPLRGAPLAVMAFLLPFLLAVILLALLLEGFFPRRETAIQVLLFTSLPAVFLAGFAWPAEAIPGWLRIPSFLIPSTAGIEGFLRIQAMGAGLGEVQPEWLTLWGLCLLYGLLAYLFLRRRRRQGR